MKPFLCILLLTLNLLGADGIDSLFQEVDDPDEHRYDLQRLTSILQDMARSERKGSIRQRLQYSPGLAGWRLLNKGWVNTSAVDMTFLVEQDPGEQRGTDHTVFSLKFDDFQGLDQLIIGNFRVRNIASILSDRVSPRSGTHPSGLIQKSQLQARPHYSSREYAYYEGAVGVWSKSNLKILGYASARDQLGRWKDGRFIEESSGIHLPGNTLIRKQHTSWGLITRYHLDQLSITLGSRNEVDQSLELGLQWERGVHLLQVISRVNQGSYQGILAGSFRMERLWFSYQMRSFHSRSVVDRSPVRTLSKELKHERALSLRILARPMDKIRLQLALDGAIPFNAESFPQLQSIFSFKMICMIRLVHREVQLQYARRTTRDDYPSEYWWGAVDSEDIMRAAIGYLHELREDFSYRLNGKIAALDQFRSFLIQQRFRWSMEDSWRVDLGYVRFSVPHYRLNHSIYETGLLESYNFFTAYGDGQRWFLCIRYAGRERSTVEFRVARTESFLPVQSKLKLELGFQLSIVL